MKKGVLNLIDEKKRSKITGNAQQGVMDFCGSFVYFNTQEYLKPVGEFIDSIDDLCQSKNLVVNFKMAFVTKSVRKIWYDYIKKINLLALNQGFNIIINWHFDEGEEEYEDDGIFIRDHLAKNCTVNLFEEEDVEKTYTLQ